jgi:hypothetical protein
MFKKIVWILSYLLIFVFLLYNSYNYLDADLGWHLKIGEEINQELSVPNYEKYNYTLEGKTWVDHEWLLNLITFKIYDNYSYLALNIFFALIVILTLIALTAFIKKYYIKQKNFSNKQSVILIIFSIFGVTAMAPHLGIRMQEITLLFTTLLLWVLITFNKSKNWKHLFFLPPLFYFWACVHAGFLIGFFIIGLFGFIKIIENISPQKIKKTFLFINPLDFKNIAHLVIFSLISLLATLLTPYGLKLYAFLSEYSDTFYMKLIAEWLPAYYAPIQYKQLLYLAIFTTLFILFFFDLYSKIKRKEKYKIDLWQIALTLVFFALSFKSKRHFPLFFVVSLPLITLWADKFISYPSDFFTNLKKSKIVKFYILAGLILTIISFIVKTEFTQSPFDRKHYCDIFPCGAVKFLKDNPQYQKSTMFNSYDWGGYLMFTYPENKTFIDGRLPQYKFAEHTLLEEYLDFFDSEKTEKKLKEYEIDLIIYRKPAKVKINWFENYVLLMEEKESELEKNKFPTFFQESPAWQKIFEDEISIIWAKKK